MTVRWASIHESAAQEQPPVCDKLIFLAEFHIGSYVRVRWEIIESIFVIEDTGLTRSQMNGL